MSEPELNDIWAAEVVRLRDERDRLAGAIVWALGYTDFRAREQGEGAYWWRTELRSRAKLTGEQIRAINARAMQAVDRAAELEALGDERDRLRSTIRTLCSSGNRLLDDLIGRSDAAESFKYHVKQAQAALTPAGGEKDD